MSHPLANTTSLYISPLELCNLNCQICYTNKTKSQLSKDQVLDFIDRYRAQEKLELVTFCGGEVFMLNWFTESINDLTKKGLMVETITNGIIDRLSEINDPNQVNLIVSLDGVEADHDLNRGQGTFQKTMSFIKKAIKMGFHLEIFCVVSTKNYDHLDQFEQLLLEEIGYLPQITYHPRKPLSYLSSHPFSNKNGETQEFGFLSEDQVAQLYQKRKVFPPREFGCHQLSLMSDGQVYGCCEGTKPIGKITDQITELVDRYKQLVQRDPSCTEPDFKCGLCNLFGKK